MSLSSIKSTLGSLFRKSALESEISEGVSVFKGVDPKGVFAGRKASGIAPTEIWMHGANDSGSLFLTNALDRDVAASSVVKQVAEQEKVSSVLLAACNIDNSLVTAPVGTKLTYGFGLGRHGSIDRNGIGAVRGWDEAVAIAEGDSTRIFPKQALQSELQRRGMSMEGLPGHAEGLSTVGVFRTDAGETRLTANAWARHTEGVMDYSLALEEAPSIIARPGRGGTVYEHSGRSFNSYQEASESLTSSIFDRGAIGRSSASMSPRELAMASATDAGGGRGFSATSYTGILAAGALALGASITIQGWKMVSDAVDSPGTPNWQYRVPQTHQAPMGGTPEQFSIRRAQIQSPDGTTDVHFDDAQLDHAGIDEAFTKHLKYGFSQSSR